MKVSRCVVLTLAALISVAGGCSEPTQPTPITPPAPPPAPPAPPPAPPPAEERFISVATVSGLEIIDLTRGSEPVWSPDGGRIAFVSGRDGDKEIFVINTDGTGLTQLTSNSATDVFPVWSPDGSRIAFASNRDEPQNKLDLWVMNADGTDQRLLSPGGGPRWSPDGQKIAFSGGGGSVIYVINADGSGLTQLTSGFSPEWSPDGRRIAFSRCEPSACYPALYVVNADGRGLTQLTSSATSHWDDSPVWSPDGSSIAFLRSHFDERYEWGYAEFLHVMRADGSDQVQLTPFESWSPSWWQDGSTLRFGSRQGMMTVPVSGGAASLLIPGVSGGSWSPDGTRIAFNRASREDSGPVHISGPFVATRRTP